MKGLPEFKPLKRQDVIDFMTLLFTQQSQPEKSCFRSLTEYEDGHYRATFNLDYFVSTEVPTKSQWNSLKKKLKRHDKRLFVFKEHGITGCDNLADAARCGYLEFGFFAH